MAGPGMRAGPITRLPSRNVHMNVEERRELLSPHSPPGMRIQPFEGSKPPFDFTNPSTTGLLCLVVAGILLIGALLHQRIMVANASTPQALRKQGWSPPPPPAPPAAPSPPPPWGSQRPDYTYARPFNKVLKGICYAPVPVVNTAQPALLDDDFASTNASALWAGDGRKDLGAIRQLGGNAVRLYGNDPSLDHKPFLDEAVAQGLQVIAGMSDFPYIQWNESCKLNGFDCYEVISKQYYDMLFSGFLLENYQYHPAINVFILANEPDLKFVPGRFAQMDPYYFCRGVLSAFDGLLDAEREVGVQPPLPRITTTFSFGVCTTCAEFDKSASLGQMAALRMAMYNPQSVGYTPRNDLWKAYNERFINSLNTANPATDFRMLFLDQYEAVFPGVPVFIAEYHSPQAADQVTDLQGILQIASNGTSLLTGISFFEYQVRYDKGGEEQSFGLFGLGSQAVNAFDYAGTRVYSWCLEPVKDANGTGTLPSFVAKVFGGPGVDPAYTCAR